MRQGQNETIPFWVSIPGTAASSGKRGRSQDVAFRSERNEHPQWIGRWFQSQTHDFIVSRGHGRAT